MITAKNYAAQAVISLQERAVTLENRQELEKAEMYRDVATIVKNSVHFVLPDGGIILKDEVSASDLYTPVNLPYPFITIEFFNSDANDQQKKILISSAQSEDFIDVFLLSGSDKNRWFMALGGVRFDRSNPTQQYIKILFPDIYDEKRDEVGSEVVDQLLDEQTTYQLFFVFSLLDALSCSNISTGVFQEEGRKNQKRIKEGKLPFYETKILVVDSSKNYGPTRVNHATGLTHASPRQHLRRGHIRRLPSGNIWVNACVVGDASKGTISKIYTVV